MNKNIELRDERGNVYIVHDEQQLNALVERGMIRRKNRRKIGQRYRYIGPPPYSGKANMTIGKLWLVIGNVVTNEVEFVCVDPNHIDFGMIFSNNPTKVNNLRDITDDEWRMITGRTPEEFELDV